MMKLPLVLEASVAFISMSASVTMLSTAAGAESFAAIVVVAAE